MSHHSVASRILFLVFGLSMNSLVGQTVDFTVVAAVSTVAVQPGINLVVGSYGGAMPGPEIRIVEGQTLRVRFINNLTEPSSIHWHGLVIPAGMDGVPGISRPPVQPGQEFTYQFVANEAGTYWFHPHAENQMNTGLHAPLIITPSNPTADPVFDAEYTVMLDDGVGNLVMNMGFMGTMTMPGFPGTSTFPSHLLNGRTSAGQIPFSVSSGQRVRLRFINVAAMENYVVALDGHPMTVTHADGRRIVPIVRQALPIGIGERYDVIVEMNNPGVWSLAAAAITNRNATLVRGIVSYSGSTAATPSATFVPANLSTGTLLDYANLAAADPVPPLTTPTRTYAAQLSMSMAPSGMAFTFNGQAWPNVTPFVVAANDQVQFTLTNSALPPMMSSEMWHPIHLHGHLMRMVTSAGGTAAPPVKDTILIRPVGLGASAQTFQFVANNPGNWLLHCHDAMHMDMGMMGLVQYSGDADADGLPDALDLDPLSAQPVLTTSDLGGGYAIGTLIQLVIQWPSSTMAYFLVGPEAPSLIDLGPFGFAAIDPYFILGTATAVNSSATLNLQLPNDPSLIGLIAPLQAVASHATLPPGGRISTFQRLRIY